MEPGPVFLQAKQCALVRSSADAGLAIEHSIRTFDNKDGIVTGDQAFLRVEFIQHRKAARGGQGEYQAALGETRVDFGSCLGDAVKLAIRGLDHPTRDAPFRTSTLVLRVFAYEGVHGDR